jgi:hypothetical protein
MQSETREEPSLGFSQGSCKQTVLPLLCLADFHDFLSPDVIGFVFGILGTEINLSSTIGVAVFLFSGC